MEMIWGETKLISSQREVRVIRLGVPQDGHASKKIEQSERKKKTKKKRDAEGEAGEEAGKASLQFPSREFRSLQSCRT